MGQTKKMLFERNPAHDEYRQRIAEESRIEWEEMEKIYPLRLACTRFEMVNGKRKKDRLWGVSLTQALKDLDADCIQINEGVFFRTEADLAQVKLLAEQNLAGWRERISQSSTPPEPKDPGTPKCPECSWPMRKRRARQGFNAGQHFWGCTKYPGCKGTRGID